MIVTPLDSASHWLNWSNALYVGGAALTVVAAMYLLYENRAIAARKQVRQKLLSEFVAVVAAIVSLVGTSGAIHFSDNVSRIKDASLQAYEKQADLEIAQAKKDTASANQQAEIANQKAQEANDSALRVSQRNLELSGQVSSDAITARSAETVLAKANKDTSDFAHALAQQQGIMAEQAKVSPQLGYEQVQMLSSLLTSFAGQDVEVHTTGDTVVERLASAIATALNHAGITTKSFSTDMGALYQGVSVAVHDANDVPLLANALVVDLRQFGIEVHPVAVPQRVPVGHVAVFLGPN